MKKYLCVLLVFISIFILSSCGKKDARSEKEALSTLLSALNDLKELSDDIDGVKSKTITQETYDFFSGRLKKIRENIDSTHLYKDIDSVKERYNAVETSYSSVETKVKALKKKIKQEEKKTTNNKKEADKKTTNNTSEKNK